ncbi:PREDICTED: myb-like protein Y isoform X2 [Rhagoletis zephyria]|uniref:myb-like protein Y isoform X2 n=1 Tax=Rhagoletis zephyria TaxID=28612 RepID=UPI0008118E58|nr:PREDICTED: myb-like protein Y isoform X2 [Rhagoletis zephyria]
MDNHHQAASTNNVSHNNTAVDYGNYDYPPPAKRGRGYAPMGEFDLSLIREFRARPGFYDRNSASFKDKLHVAHQWQEISNKLGFDVSLLKDRMLQLRNRYNLEKRRLEQLRDENPGQSVDSPWPLFHHLHFLSEHIRPRRSYKSMQPRTSLADSADDDEDYTERPRPKRHQQRQLKPHLATRSATAGGGRRDSYSDGGGDGGDGGGAVGGGGGAHNSSAETYANGMLTVKMEEPDGEDPDVADAESGSQSGTEDNSRGHPLKLSAASTLLSMQQRQPHSMSPYNKSSTSSSMALNKRSSKYSTLPAAPPASIKIRRLDTMQERTPGVAHTQQRASNNDIPSHSNFNNSHTNNNNKRQRQQEYTSLMSRQVQVNRRCLNNSEQKYAAFGEFVSASLLELPATRALQLVEKFTSEVVRVLLDSTEKSPQVGAEQSMAQQQQQQQQPPPPLQLLQPLLSQAQPQQVPTQFQQMNGSISEALNGV